MPPTSITVLLFLECGIETELRIFAIHRTLRPPIELISSTLTKDTTITKLTTQNVKVDGVMPGFQI